MDYNQAAEELRQLREYFYRTRLQRGDRLSLVEAQWLFARDMERLNVRLSMTMKGAIEAVAAFTKAVRGLREILSGARELREGGMRTSN